jgi:hypothetical protein
MFELIFNHKSQLFRYGFEVNRHEVTVEWFYHHSPAMEESSTTVFRLVEELLKYI